ncbi:hypothetical protein VX159_07635 [Dechloromonas sp. ZY10]|uniref:hypothetical protein n=1 Tax=Dechloromonas aquae TaxID=2664436 RepID=UPI00352844CA
MTQFHENPLLRNTLTRTHGPFAPHGHGERKFKAASLLQSLIFIIRKMPEMKKNAFLTVDREKAIFSHPDQGKPCL